MLHSFSAFPPRSLSFSTLSNSNEFRIAVAMRLIATSRPACARNSWASFVVTDIVSCSEVAFGIDELTADEMLPPDAGLHRSAIRYSRAEQTTSGSKLQMTSFAPSDPVPSCTDAIRVRIVSGQSPRNVLDGPTRGGNQIGARSRPLLR